jgi:hypothetical protein
MGPEPPSDTAVRKLEKLLASGFEHWGDVEFPEAIETFSEAVAMARWQPQLVTESGKLRQQVFFASVALCLALNRSGEIAGARESMAEVIRSYPDLEIPFDRFGPEPGALRRQVEKGLVGQGRGRLVVTADKGPGARIFVNERFAGTQAVDIEVFPGRYRVFVTLDNRPSRIREIEVAVGVTAEVTIDPLFDQALRLDSRVALAFPDEESRRAHEAAYAARLAGMVEAELGAIVLGIESPPGGRSILVGSAVSLDGAVSRRAHIRATVDAPVNQLYALAAYLDGEAPAAGIEVDATGAAVANPRSARKAHRGRFRYWKWLPLAAGVAAVGVGTPLVYLDGRGTCADWEIAECPNRYRSRAVGLIYLGAGLAAIAAGVLMWRHDARSSRRASGSSRALGASKETAVVIIPGIGGGATFGLAGRF